MTRLQGVTDRDGLSPAGREVFDALIANRGGIRGPFALLLHTPDLAGPIQALGAKLRFDGRLEAGIREAVILTTARTWDCGYEWQAHEAIALEAGVAPAVVAAIADGRTNAIEGEVGLAVRLAEALLREHAIHDDAYAFASARWTPAELLEIVVVIGYYGLLATVLNAFEVPPLARPGRDRALDSEGPGR